MMRLIVVGLAIAMGVILAGPGHSQTNPFNPDLNWCNTQGSLAMRGPARWQCLTPGTAGQALLTGGPGAIPYWNTVTGIGTVTSVAGSGGSTGLTLSGGPITGAGTLTLGGTLGVTNGGSGQTSYTNGQLLIGNTTGNTLTKSTLTAGTGIDVTNGAGSISIALGANAAENNFGIKTANTVFAAPDGSNGNPSFRTLVPQDLPYFTTVNPAIPYSPGGTGFGIANNSFSINYAPSSILNSEALQVYRTDTWTGGNIGDTTSAFRAYMTAPAGRSAYSWTGTFVMNNDGTGPDDAENVALYAQTFKNSSGKSWATTFELTDTTGLPNPARESVAVEIDNGGDGDDINLQRIGLNLVARRHGSSGTMTAGRAIYISNNANAQWKYGIYCAGSTITDSCVSMSETQNLNFALNKGGRYLGYDTDSMRFYNAQNSVTTLQIMDYGAVRLPTLITSQLPTCNSGQSGSLAYVSDIAGALVWNTTFSGGGTTHSTVLCNGTNWVVK